MSKDKQRQQQEDGVTQIYAHLESVGEAEVVKVLKSLRVNNFGEWQKAMEEIQSQIIAQQQQHQQQPQPQKAQGQKAQPQKAQGQSQSNSTLGQPSLDDRLGTQPTKDAKGKVMTAKDVFNEKYLGLDEVVAAKSERVFYEKRLEHAEEVKSITASGAVLRKLSLDKALDIEESFPANLIMLEKYKEEELDAWHFQMTGMSLDEDIRLCKESLRDAITIVRISDTKGFFKGMGKALKLGVKSIFLTPTKRKTLIAHNKITARVGALQGRIVG